MSDYSNFVTDSSIKRKEEENRQARELILEKAKKKYEAEERRKEKQKESGEGTWMLNTVSKRIHKEQKTIEDAKSKSKKKKKKKKKHKKHSSSSSSENSDAEWVESKDVSSSNTSESTSGKPLQRDSWMEAPLDLFPAVSRQEIRDAANKEKEIAKLEAEKHRQPGQHARELNPYWKDGGSGLPTASLSSTSTSSSSASMGDGGLSWLLKSLSRMKQQAKDENRSLEEIAAERYGSLDGLMSMIRKAEKSQRRGGNGDMRDRESGGKRDYKDRDRGRDMARDKEDLDRDRDRKGERDAGREMNSYRSERDRERDRFAGRNRDEESERDRDRRRSREREERKYGSERQSHDNRSTSGRRLAFQRPQSDDEEGNNSFSKCSESGRKIFKRPGEDVDDEKRGNDKAKDRFGSQNDNRERKRGYDSRERTEGWRRPSQKDDDETLRWKKRDAGKSQDEREVEKKKDRPRKTSSSDSSSSSSDDEDKSSKTENTKMSESEEEPSKPQKIMSEAELNDLAAKVLRAEIMGDESLASELKATLEEARRIRESSKTADGNEGGKSDFIHAMMEKGGKKDKEEEGDENVVILSRTNKAGMVRPVLPSSSEEWGRSAGKKRKKKNVATHGESGERTKYFHDDDNFDLKTLVEREKAGTAEDQNSMFARLAGRETDRDMDVDDMFVSKAARNHQEEEAVNRDKMAAIMEHRKKSSAMDKCTRCFDKVPKHLIVAIGRKSYLCLPDHASLTEGHCLIVPMAHSSAATSLDEDVWQDIQYFRKSLVQMFTSQEKDMVIMETAMRLKHFPHMAIECIPLEREVGDLAPIYFKKAMQEVGPEWAHNKKIHDLSKKDVRHTVPKGFPYFSVDFGLQGGFAHVIEDEATFPSYFGREIVGGMLDVEPGLWRKPRKQNFEDQRQKVLQFEQWWSPFDWTQDLD